jgi:galactokinase
VRPIELQAVEAFRRQFGTEPEVVASAPGRVNLIGEHTDYTGGFVLPCAIGRRVAVANGHGPAEVVSADFKETRPFGAADKSWADYPRGVLWSLQDAAFAVEPVRTAIAGDVPLGAGLSSSAAIECATAVAYARLFGLEIPRPKLALLCQRAENAFVGVNCGIMDQYASLLCSAGAALLVDCRSLEAETVPLDLERAGLALVVCDTRVPRRLAATGYNERRATCEAAAMTIGVPQLRDARVTDLGRLDGIALKRARHVVTENARVQAAASALRADDFAAFGHLMFESHQSLRDDFEVSVPELDEFVEAARAAGALGARLTGAGFGGCAIALAPTARLTALRETISSRFQSRGFRAPEFYDFVPSAGAEVAE